MPVPAGVGDKDNQKVDLAVSLLAMEPPLERLEIIEYRLCLNCDPPAGAVHEEIPGPQIAANWQRDLGPQGEGRAKVRLEPAQASLLARVPDRIAGGKGADREREPDHRAPGSDIRERSMIDITAFEAQELLMRGARRRRNDAETQSGADAGRSKLTAESADRVGGLSPTAIGRSLPGAHGASLRIVDWLPLS